VVPESQAALDASESAAVTSQVLLRAPEDARLEVMVRFLHPCHRQVDQRRDGGFDAVDRLTTTNGRMTITSRLASSAARAETWIAVSQSV
jgi:hypothetical protein